MAPKIASNVRAGVLLEEDDEPVAEDSTTDELPADDEAEEAIIYMIEQDREHNTERYKAQLSTSRCSLKTDGPLNCACASDSGEVG